MKLKFFLKKNTIQYDSTNIRGYNILEYLRKIKFAQSRTTISSIRSFLVKRGIKISEILTPRLFEQKRT